MNRGDDPTAALRLHAVAKSFGGTQALRGVSMAARPGSFLALLGPSGCGKSTLLRVVAGLEAADAGHVEIGGRDVTALPPAGRGIAMVFQSYALFPHLTVAENIVFGLRARRLWASRRCWRGGHRSSPVGSSSAWRWPARWSLRRRSA